MEFYPAALPVPGELRTDRLFLRPLRASDVALDYDAVMASAPELRAWSQSGWPAADFTLAENRADLERHEREHLAREAFTFTVLDPGGTRCLGCVYIQPVEPAAAAVCAGALRPANVGFWVRTSERAGDLDRHLFAALRDWLATAWGFDRILHTLSVGEDRQAALMGEAGLEPRAAITRSDGRACRVFA